MTTKPVYVEKENRIDRDCRQAMKPAVRQCNDHSW